MDPFLSIDPVHNSKLILNQFETLIQNKDIHYLKFVQKMIGQRLKELEINRKFIHLKKSLS